MPHSAMLTLNRRRQAQVVDEHSRNTWKIVADRLRVPAAEVAIGICDIWDKHWAVGAARGVDKMAPRMIVEYVEKSWCPTILSRDLAR